MGLAFLNKKSWHTGSFQNIEKVWKAEQAEKERQRQMREAQRRLKEERHYEEIKKIQAQAGLIPKSHLERLDWMYEGTAIKNTSSEEYLLGKPYVEQDPEAPAPEWRPTLCKETTANQANERFTKIHEDPLYSIMQEELRRKKDILNNPVKMKQLQEDIENMKKGRKRRRNHRESDKESTSSQRSDSEPRKKRSAPKMTEEERSQLYLQMKQDAEQLSHYRDSKEKDYCKKHHKQHPKFMKKTRESALESKQRR